MTAPTRGKKPAPRTGERRRTRSAAGERAYARREERRERSLRELSRRPSKRQAGGGRKPTVAATRKARQLQEKVTHSRVSMVVVVMSVLGVGLAAILWLSIAAVSGSYQLQQAEARVNELSERKEELIREVSQLNSPAVLQRRAEELGMRPGPPAIHLVVQPDGTVLPVGESADPGPVVPAPPAPQPSHPEPAEAP